MSRSWILLLKETINRLDQNFATSSIIHYLGGDYMIPFCRYEISTRPTVTGFTLRLHGEINNSSLQSRAGFHLVFA